MHLSNQLQYRTLKGGMYVSNTICLYVCLLSQYIMFVFDFLNTL